MERSLSGIFRLETIGYKSITKLQSRQTGRARCGTTNCYDDRPLACPFLGRKMKRIIYCIIFFLYLIPLYSQEYSYKVFGEDGIYERNIKNDK